MKMEDNLKYTYIRTGFCHILCTVILEDVGDYKSPTILVAFNKVCLLATSPHPCYNNTLNKLIRYAVLLCLDCLQ